MKASEFLIEEIQCIDTEGLDAAEWITLYEYNFDKKLILESIEQSDIDYLDGLKSYSKHGIIGQKYLPAFIMLLPKPNKQITYLGATQVLTLLKIDNDEHIFTDGQLIKKWPFTRLTDVSYSRLYLINNKDDYDGLNIALTLKFGVSLPEVNI